MESATEHILALTGALLALILRSVIIAGEAGLATIGGERAAALSRLSRSGSALARLKADPERSAGAIRASLALCFAIALAIVAHEAVEVDRTFSGHPSPVLVTIGGAGLVWVVTVLADVLPRSLAAAHAERWALASAPVILLLRWMLSPLISLVAVSVDLLVRPFGARVRFGLPPPPLDEIERILTHTRQEGAPEPALVRSLFEFGDRTVKEIMVPRTDIVAIPHDMDPRKIADFLVDQGHTRVPVYRETLDTIIGVVHIKDLLPLLSHPELIILHDLLRPPVFVPWNRPIGKVMRELQRKHQHFAVVVDEYGGVAGIITIEDIIEQIIGDIRDEFDEAAQDLVVAGDGALLVKGEMRVSQFNEQFGAVVPEEAGYETMGGFLSALAGAIPSEGDRFYQGGWEFQVTRRDPRRVLEVRVIRLRTSPDPSPDEPRA